MKIDSAGREVCGRCGKVLQFEDRDSGRCLQCGEPTLYKGQCVLLRQGKSKTKFKCSECGEINTIGNPYRYKFCCGCGRYVREILENVKTLDEFLKGVNDNEKNN